MSNPVWPPMIFPQPTPRNQNWQAAPPQPIQTTYINNYVTLDQYRQQFGITINPPTLVPPRKNGP